MAEELTRAKRMEMAADLAESQLARAVEIAKGAGHPGKEPVIAALLQAVVTNYWKVQK